MFNILLQYLIAYSTLTGGSMSVFVNYVIFLN